MPSQTAASPPRAQLLAAGALLAAAAAAAHAYRRSRRRPRNVGSAPKEWGLGHLPRLLRSLRGYRLLDVIVDSHREFGETVEVDLPLQPPFVLTVDPKNVEHVLRTNFANYPKGELLRSRMCDLLGNGIFNADGAAWHSQRKTASRMFTLRNFKNSIWQVVSRKSDRVAEKLVASVGGGAIDVFSLLNRFTLDSIGEIGFGHDIGSLDDAGSPFLKSFDQAQQTILLRFVTPAWQILRFFGLATERGTRKHFGLLRDYSRRIVCDLKHNLDGPAGDSFVGHFMKSGEAPSDELLGDLVMNFLIAGRDTTAQAMGWCLWYLMQHPEIEAKILAEGERVCGTGQPLTHDKIMQLEYLGAVISESLRLHPSVPIGIKEALEDDVLPSGAFVPRGCTVAYSAYAMGRSTKIWGEDAADFWPERWLEMAQRPDSYSFPVFHAGPRECLGKRLAQVEMRALLLTVLRAVRLELAVPAAMIRPDMQLTIGMSSGLPCFVHRREAI